MTGGHARLERSIFVTMLAMLEDQIVVRLSVLESVHSEHHSLFNCSLRMLCRKPHTEEAVGNESAFKI